MRGGLGLHKPETIMRKSEARWVDVQNLEIDLISGVSLSRRMRWKKLLKFDDDDALAGVSEVDLW